MRRFLPALPVLLLFIGCSGERETPASRLPTEGASSAQTQAAAPHGRGGTLRIEPDEVYRGTHLRLSATGFPLDAARVEWLVNDRVLGNSLETGTLRRGDRVQARVVDRADTVFSQVVTVRNSLPEIRGIRFVLGEGASGRGIGVEADAYDADEDTVRYEIAWARNGEPSGSGSRLATPVKRGDKVTVTITPFDGEERGRPATLSRDILNTPPVIEGQEQFQVHDNIVTFHVRASDADGDPLGYSLKDAPAGMSIDRATGWVRWGTSPGTTGKIPFTVTVSDGTGGEATARFTVSIQEEPPSGSR